MPSKLHPIAPCFVFNNQAEQAVKFYVSTFKRSKILGMTRYTEGQPGAPGTVATVTFELMGQKMFAANGGPQFTFSMGLSLYVSCDTQQEIDRLWETLSRGGEKQYCGWVQDRYGVSWQIVPRILEKMIADKDPQRGHRVNQAIYGMRKLDIAALQAAYAVKTVKKKAAARRGR